VATKIKASEKLRLFTNSISNLFLAIVIPKKQLTRFGWAGLFLSVL
jgi:hypothetical protein